MNEVPHKPRAMVRFLLEQISSGQLGDGARVPSMRELMDRFDLSYGSVKRGIDYLSENGYVEKMGGRGTFVRRRSEHQASNVAGQRLLAVFLQHALPEHRHGVYLTVLLGLQEAAAATGYSLVLSYLRCEDASPEAFERLSNGAAGMVFLAEYDEVLTELPLTVPVVGVCMHNSMGGSISVIDVDPMTTAQQATRYFRDRNLKHVVVISSSTPAHHARAEPFMQLWQRDGGTIEEAPTHDSIAFDPRTGYLFTTGSLLQRASEDMLRQTGQILSRTIPALTVDAKSRLNPDFHPASCIGPDWHVVGKYAFEECVYRVNTPGSTPKRIYVPGRLHEVEAVEV